VAGSHDSPHGPIDSLDWLTQDKLLELVAHDINNMCHAALSYVDLALDPKLAPEARAKFLATAKHMTHRASRFAPHLKLFNELRVTDSCAEPSDLLSKVASDARIKAIDLNLGAPLALTTSGDALASRVRGGKFVTAAVVHLLDNAVRYQRSGASAAVSLDARLDGDFVTVTVTDNGRGFAKGAEAYVAKRFTTPGSVSGAGLGLAFARLLAERAGGSVAVGAAPGAPPSGALVRLRLPLASP